MPLALFLNVFMKACVGRLELRKQGEGVRHELDGKPVEQNTPLELRLRGNLWILGRYQWSGASARWPGLRVELGGTWEKGNPELAPAAVMALHPDAELRWPR
jgi:hypothetical protein